MTTEELNQALFDKANSEMKQFANWLLKQTPEEVLNHAYEYVTKTDIVADLEYLELEDAQARALLQSDTLLDEIYKAYARRYPLRNYGTNKGVKKKGVASATPFGSI